MKIYHWISQLEVPLLRAIFNTDLIENNAWTVSGKVEILPDPPASFLHCATERFFIKTFYALHQSLKRFVTFPKIFIALNRQQQQQTAENIIASCNEWFKLQWILLEISINTVHKQKKASVNLLPNLLLSISVYTH